MTFYGALMVICFKHCRRYRLEKGDITKKFRMNIEEVMRLALYLVCNELKIEKKWNMRIKNHHPIYFTAE